MEDFVKSITEDEGIVVEEVPFTFSGLAAFLEKEKNSNQVVELVQATEFHKECKNNT